MRNSKFLTRLGISVVIASLFFASCHKNTTPVAEDTGYATDQATTEKTFNDVESIADQGSMLSAGGNLNYRTTATTSGGCAMVTRAPGTITINFGATDCTCKDGRNRRGEIIVSYTGNYSDSGSVHTITFNNFFQNDNKVTGSKTVTNMGHNSLGQPFYDVAINGALTLSGGGTISAVWQRIRTWTAGYATPTDFTDDVYSVSGSGTMIRANGDTVLVNISTAAPLVMAYGCKWIEAGTITYTLPGGLNRSLDYGNTAICDNQAVLTLPSGVSYNITLP